MSLRGLGICVMQIALAAAIVATIAAVPSFRVACVGLAMILPAGLAVGGALAAWRGKSLSTDAASWVDLAALPVALVLAAVPLVAAWTSVRTHGAFVAGLLPYSDAGNYLAGADRLLSDGTLDEWNSRRPLNATLLAVRLAMGGGSLRVALMLQAGLLGMSASLAARAVAASLGRAAGAIVLGAVLVFGGIFVPTTMSECLGLTLGSLSLAVLWQAARAPTITRMAVGFMLLTAALSARSGPFGVLACLLVWSMAAPTAGGRWRTDLRSGLAALCGTIGGFALNSLVLRIHHGARAGTQSNFAYTLYGLAHRGVGWERAIHDHPEIHSMTDSEGGSYIQSLALQAIRARPWNLVVGLWNNVVCAVDSVTDNATGGALAHHPRAQWVLALAAVVAAVWATARALGRQRSDRARWLAIASVVGIAASVPVIYMDGRERVFAAAFPFAMAWAALILSGGPSLEGRSEDVLPETAMAWGVGLLLCAAAGVTVVKSRAMQQLPTVQCLRGQESIALDARVVPFVNILVAGDSFAPDVSLRDFRRGYYRDPNLGSNTLAASLRQVSAWMTLAEVYDPRARRLNYVLGPKGWTDSLPHVACGVALAPGSWRVLRLTGMER